MDEPDFHSLVAQLKLKGVKPSQELVDWVRVKFPKQKMRYDRLLDQLRLVANEFMMLPSSSDIRRNNEIGDRMDQARRNDQPIFRALLLKWLWIYHHEEATLYFRRWSISIIDESRKPAVNSASQDASASNASSIKMSVNDDLSPEEISTLSYYTKWIDS